MQRNVIFGGNLIWRMAQKHIFWQELNLAVKKHKIEYEIYINAFFIKKLYEKFIFFANNQDNKKKKNINLARTKFGEWRIYCTKRLYALYLYDRSYRFTIYQFYVWNVINLYIYYIYFFTTSEIRFFSFSAILYSLWYTF